MATPRNSRPVSILISCLGALTILFALWPTYRAFLNIEIEGNEGWNAYFADAAMGRMPLYPSPDKLITNNYPPLSFYIVGASGRLIGDILLAGRLLSLASLVAIAVGVALAIKQLGGSATAAGVGAAYFVATMCRFFAFYVGMNEPQLLAQAVMTIGFVAFLRAMARDRGYAAPILLMVAGGFIKHNVVLLPLTAMVWLAYRRPRQALKSGLLALGAIAVAIALCFAAYGPDFWANLTCPRALIWRQAFDALGHLQWIAVGLLVWLYVGLTLRANPHVQLCNLLITLGLLTFFLQKAGDGVGYNAQFDLVAAVSIGVGLAVAYAPHLPLARRFSPDALRFALLLAICLRLIASTRLGPIRFLTDPTFHAEIATRQAAMSATVARIKRTPGDVVSDILACFRAGKPFLLDPFNTHQRILDGKLPPDALARFIASRHPTYVDWDPLLSWNTTFSDASHHSAR